MRIKYKLRAPLSHIGEVASNGSYFQTILTKNGKLPVVTANSVRGQIRDSCALHLLDTIGCKVDKEVFNVLFSGGNLNGTMKEDVEKAKLVREHFPMISLLGSGLGDMIMSGKLIMTFLYPVCAESEETTGIYSEKSWHELIDEIEFTRTDDGKNDLKSKYLDDATEETKAKASTQMRFSVQYMAAGTEFVQDVMFSDFITDLEMGAFFAGVKKWFENPKLGGMSAKGFGIFDANIENEISVNSGKIEISEHAKKLIADYENFIKSEMDEYFYLLQTKVAKKNGKK